MARRDKWLTRTGRAGGGVERRERCGCSNDDDYLLNSRRWEITVPLIIGLVLLALSFLSILILFCGLNRRQPYLLIPHIVMQVRLTMLVD
jgi:hypothetical protein